MKSRKRIYPIFLSHAGCPFHCVYCDQQKIASHFLPRPESKDILDHCQRELSTLRGMHKGQKDPMEVAFYGGTFTALPKPLLRQILELVKPLVREGVLSGVRFSTRPDFVTSSICDLLENYPVKAVELGVQSFDDEVLAKSRRGHDSLAVYEAVDLVRRRGWTLGIQLMLGLPGDDPERFLESVKRAASLHAGLIRFYPVLVLEGTTLARWYKKGSFRPLTLEEAIHWCVPAYDHLVKWGTPPVRMGLQADTQLEKPGTILAGPYHPSFGYLVRVAWWRRRIDEALESHAPPRGEKACLTLRVPKRAVSEVIGPKGMNIQHWVGTWSLGQLNVAGADSWDEPNFELDWSPP